MARKTRYAPPEFAHHVVNRGNDRQMVFRDHFDYMAFLELIDQGVRRFPVRIYGDCVMPNHFHLLIQPDVENALSSFMQWVTCRYACTFRQQTDTVGHGHVFQRRFWSAPVRDGNAFIAVLRYIEANPVRAGLVHDAEAWEWSSLRQRARGDRFLSTSPVPLPDSWPAFVNTPLPETMLTRIRRAAVPQRGRPMLREPLI